MIVDRSIILEDIIEIKSKINHKFLIKQSLVMNLVSQNNKIEKLENDKYNITKTFNKVIINVNSFVN